MMKFMNRSKWMSAIVALLLMMLVGCSSGPVGKQTGNATQPVQEAATTSPEATEAKVDHRVVSTTVAITQIMDLLDIDLVGIPKSVKTLPKRYDNVTKIGSPMSPDMELVKSLKPTEVLSVTTLQYDLEPVFKNAKINASFLDLTSLESMQKEIIKLGQRFGKEVEASKLVAEYEDKLTKIRAAVEGKPKPTVLILLGVPGSYLVATEYSYAGDLVRLLGGINIAEGAKVEYLASNTEYLQKSNPDVILRLAHGMPDEVVKMFDKEFKKNDIWKHFKAVKNGRVFDMEEAVFGTTGNYRVVEALDSLIPMLYP